VIRFLCALAVLGGLGLGTGGACASNYARSQAVTSPTLSFNTALGTVTVEVEVADDLNKRTVGLMYRQELDAQRGMVFVFPRPDNHVFWMRNTYVPLDMIFINAASEVVGVVAHAEPLTETPRAIGVPSLFVLEVNAGFASRHQIGVGTKVIMTGVPQTVAQ
jgi:uncharacterized protein